LRWTLVGLFIIVFWLTGTLNAQQVVYCPIQVEKGSLWVDHYPIKVKNLGNGVAVGVQVTKSFPVYSQAPPFGTSGVAIQTVVVGVIPRLEPGDDAIVKVPVERGSLMTAPS